MGYKNPFGARQRYFITGNVDDQEEILRCVLSLAAAWALEVRDQNMVEFPHFAA